MHDIRTRSDHFAIDPSTIPGWAVDANPQNDPTYPYRDRSGDDGQGANWQRPSTQPQTVELLQSIEHIRRPAVFGSSVPPRGLSGMIRRLAFRWSESNWMHWLLLMGADRINVAEGVAADIGRGKLPNIPAEMGARAEWRHNKKGFFLKTGLVLGASAGLAAMLVARSRKRSSADTDRLAAPDLVELRRAGDTPPS